MWRHHWPSRCKYENVPVNEWSDRGALIRALAAEYPDLNPVDYSIWGAFQQLVYRRRRHIQDVEHLKQVLQTCWEQTGQDVNDRAIAVLQTLSLVVATGGGHIEQRFD